MPKSKKLWSLAGACVLAGVLVAGLLYPAASGVGIASNRAASAVENVSSELLSGTLPEVTTMTDAAGTPIARLFDQYRYQVGYNDISPDMIRAIISIEDRRFLEHDGVDWKGTIRAFLKNSSSGEVQQGASTLDQQYIKNYQLLVLARTEADRQAAIETTPARKLREVRMALTMEQSLRDEAKRKGLDDAAAKQEAKKQIVTRYLNVVPFGNNAYGIEAAAQTYFGKSAKDLTVGESALLAGMVQSSSALNPYTNPDGVLERRNTVLDTMMDNGWFDLAPPKSLDRNHFHIEGDWSLEDGAATLTAMTASAIAEAVRLCPERPKQVLVCGGGRHNPTLMAQLKHYQLPAQPVEAVGWNGDMLEAQAFAYLAARSVQGLALSLPTTTGVLEPTTGGALINPS